MNKTNFKIGDIVKITDISETDAYFPRKKDRLNNYVKLTSEVVETDKGYYAFGCASLNGIKCDCFHAVKITKPRNQYALKHLFS